MSKQDIRELTFQELLEYFKSIKAPSYRADQVFDWLYKKGVRSFEDMRNLPPQLRAALAEKFAFHEPRILKKQRSKDKTVKFLLEWNDGEKVETVLIPTATRTTVCVSTQAGCKFGCRFCASGIGGWKRDLNAAEILSQVLLAKEESRSHAKPLSHIVFMGVGEPLDNSVNLMKAVRTINNEKGLNIAARRITVSTCGVIPKILELGKQGIQIELAVSLHGYDDASRNVLMPVNRKYPFGDLIRACKEYQSNYRRQITFEYILIKDVTCTEKAVKALKKAFQGLICKMNLIPYNPVSEFDHRTPSHKEMIDFKERLARAGIHATLRTPRGRDVAAACGQLRHTANK